MRTFEQLTQDEQMQAVEMLVDEIVRMAAGGETPVCFEDFSEQLEEVMDEISFDDSAEDAVRNKIESDYSMKLAMLRHAGKIAKQAFYPEDDEFIIRLP
jgi:hypothetical protein